MEPKYEGNYGQVIQIQKDPKISPIYSDLSVLPKFTIITGSRDILKTDCRNLHKLLNNQNIEHNYIEYKNQGHVFGILPIKERKLLIDDIASIINGGKI